MACCLTAPSHYLSQCWVKSSKRFCGICLRAIPQAVIMILIHNMYFETTLSKLLLHLPGTNELTYESTVAQNSNKWCICKVLFQRIIRTLIGGPPCDIAHIQHPSHYLDEWWLKLWIFYQLFFCLIFQSHFIEHHDIMVSFCKKNSNSGVGNEVMSVVRPSLHIYWGWCQLIGGSKREMYVHWLFGLIRSLWCMGSRHAPCGIPVMYAMETELVGINTRI